MCVWVIWNVLRHRRSVQCVKYQRARLMRMSWKLFPLKIKFEVLLSAILSGLQSYIVVFAFLGNLLVCYTTKLLYTSTCVFFQPDSISKSQSYVSHGVYFCFSKLVWYLAFVISLHYYFLRYLRYIFIALSCWFSCGIIVVRKIWHISVIGVVIIVGVA